MRPKNKKLYPGRLVVSATGHVQYGETIKEAAKREAKEELGIDLKDMQVLFTEPKRLDESKPYLLCAPVLAAYDGEIKPNPQEVDVERSGFYKKAEILEMLEKPDLMTPSVRTLLNWFFSHEKITE